MCGREVVESGDVGEAGEGAERIGWLGEGAERMG